MDEKNTKIVDRIFTRTDVKNYVEALCKLHSIEYSESQLDRIGECFTELGGDEVKTDSTTRLILTLARKKIISNTCMLWLFAVYKKRTLD